MNLFHNFCLRLWRGEESLAAWLLFKNNHNLGDLEPLSPGWDTGASSGGAGVPLYMRGGAGAGAGGGATSLEAEQEDEKLNKAIALLQGQYYNY